MPDRLRYTASDFGAIVKRDNGSLARISRRFDSAWLHHPSLWAFEECPERRMVPAIARGTRATEGCFVINTLQMPRASAGKPMLSFTLNEGLDMKQVYILQSLSHPDEYYTGSTADINERLKEHNRMNVPHTSKYAPWHPVVVIHFKDNQKAIEFERYLKSGSGRAFAMKHFR